MQTVPSGEFDTTKTLSDYVSDVYAVAMSDSFQMPDVPYDVMRHSLDVQEIGFEANDLISNVLATISDARTQRKFLSIAAVVSRVVTARQDREACEALLTPDPLQSNTVETA